MTMDPNAAAMSGPNMASSVITTIWSLLAVSTIILCLRLAVKLRIMRRLYFDDLCVIFAWVLISSAASHSSADKPLVLWSDTCHHHNPRLQRRRRAETRDSLQVRKATRSSSPRFLLLGMGLSFAHGWPYRVLSVHALGRWQRPQNQALALLRRHIRSAHGQPDVSRRCLLSVRYTRIAHMVVQQEPTPSPNMLEADRADVLWLFFWICQYCDRHLPDSHACACHSAFACER